MKECIKILACIFFLSISPNIFAQVGLTSYSVYAIAVNTDQNRRISGELKTFTNRQINEIFMEPAVFYNLKPSKYHRFSFGLGVKLAPLIGDDHIYALTIPVSLEVYPVPDFKKISILFELAPELIVEQSADLRSLWGIRYTFGKE